MRDNYIAWGVAVVAGVTIGTFFGLGLADRIWEWVMLSLNQIVAD